MRFVTFQQPFRHGERMTRDEFISRWDEAPNLKYAELLDGVVMLQPIRCEEHGALHASLAMWCGMYEATTPGCRGNHASSCYMRDDMPQPETSLRILPEFGGQSTLLERNGLHYVVGAPELIAEVKLTTREDAFEAKAQLYRKAGVREYISVQPETQRVEWWRFTDGACEQLKPTNGILRSRVFPGLWLDTDALLNDDKSRMLEVLNTGKRSREHVAFVKALARNRRSM